MRVVMSRGRICCRNRPNSRAHNKTTGAPAGGRRRHDCFQRSGFCHVTRWPGAMPGVVGGKNPFLFARVFRCGTIRAMDEGPSFPQPDPAKQLQDMQVLLSVAHAMAGTLALPELLTLILDSARRVL